MNLTEKFLQFALLGAEWVLWLLVALSVWSLYVIIERALFFRSISGKDTALRRPLLAALGDGDREQARRVVESATTPGARMVREMLGVAGQGEASVEAAMNAVRPEEKIRLEHNLGFLGTLGANAPFIGLFGTVLGIMRAFRDLATSGLQQGDTTKIMEGISEALVATAVGLLVAIPAVVAYNLFQRRVRRSMSEAEGLAQSAFTMLTRVHTAPAEPEED